MMFRWMLASVGVMLALSANTSRAADDRIIGTFDADIAVADGSYGE